MRIMPSIKKDVRNFGVRIRSYFKIGLIIIALVLLVSLVRSIMKIIEAGEKIAEADKKVLELKKENEELLKKLEVVESQEFVELQIRDKLSMVKEGEIVVVLPDEQVLRQIAPKDIEEEETLPPPNWKRWLELFL